MKYCSKCETHKSSDSFQKNKRTKDGLQSQCRECHSHYWQKRAKKAKKDIPPIEKVCSTCKKIKPASSFTTGHSGNTGLKHSCKECTKKFNIKHLYGLSFEEYESMLESQDN